MLLEHLRNVANLVLQFYGAFDVGPKNSLNHLSGFVFSLFLVNSDCLDVVEGELALEDLYDLLDLVELLLDRVVELQAYFFKRGGKI